MWVMAILWPPEMNPMLVTEGELRQTVTHTASQQCVEANGAGVGASDNGKGTNNGAVGWGPITYPTAQPFGS